MMVKIVFLVFLCLTLPFPAADALTIPETIHYDLMLSGFKVGSMSLAVQQKDQNVQITSTVSTVKTVSLFYEVDDIAVSTLGPNPSRKKSTETFAYAPSSFKVNLNEGPHRIHKEFTFDGLKKKITYTDHLIKEQSSFALKADIFDPLSSLYRIRWMPLTVGKSVYVNVFNNKKMYKVQVQVLRKEQITTPLGTFSTIVVRSNMDSVGDGVFYYPGDISIWLTDDAKRLPVMIEKRLNALVEGNLPEVISNNMPDFIKQKISAGAVRAVSVKAF